MKETLKEQLFSKIWEECRMPSHSVSLGKQHEGSELTNTSTDNPYLKGTDSGDRAYHSAVL